MKKDQVFELFKNLKENVDINSLEYHGPKLRVAKVIKEQKELKLIEKKTIQEDIVVATEAEAKAAVKAGKKAFWEHNEERLVEIVSESDFNEINDGGEKDSVKFWVETDEANERRKKVAESKPAETAPAAKPAETKEGKIATGSEGEEEIMKLLFEDGVTLLNKKTMAMVKDDKDEVMVFESKEAADKYIAEHATEEFEVLAVEKEADLTGVEEASINECKLTEGVVTSLTLEGIEATVAWSLLRWTVAQKPIIKASKGTKKGVPIVNWVNMGKMLIQQLEPFAKKGGQVTVEGPMLATLASLLSWTIEQKEIKDQSKNSFIHWENIGKMIVSRSKRALNIKETPEPDTKVTKEELPAASPAGEEKKPEDKPKAEEKPAEEEKKPEVEEAKAPAVVGDKVGAGSKETKLPGDDKQTGMKPGVEKPKPLDGKEKEAPVTKSADQLAKTNPTKFEVIKDAAQRKWLAAQLLLQETNAKKVLTEKEKAFVKASEGIVIEAEFETVYEEIYKGLVEKAKGKK